METPTATVKEEAHNSHKSKESKESWFSYVAVTTGLCAVFAAIAALISNYHLNKAMIEQIQASDQWSYYQAKGIKSNVLTSKMELLASLGHTPTDKDQQKVAQYKEEQDGISKVAKEKEASSVNHLWHQAVLARAVTLFQVTIAIAAIAVLTNRKFIWHLGLGLTVIGIGFLIQGLFLSG